jgi:hypothetical protein
LHPSWPTVTSATERPSGDSPWDSRTVRKLSSLRRTPALLSRPHRAFM